MMEKLASVLMMCGIVNAALYDGVISTSHGQVQGHPAFNSTPNGNLTNWKDITVWRGIPFAASTAGENRWKAPKPAGRWNGTFDAKNYGDICPSTSSNSEYTISEDCLNLNIWTSATSTKQKRPVVMWSYPAYSTAADALFDGAGMADAGVVYVNYNYRTGALGWLAHPELSQERVNTVGFNSSGNYGMLDQFAALKWIHDNIEAFGGDPNRITVMGQSAGSAATQHILNSPLTKGLIVGAIIESGVRDPHDPLCETLAENYRNLTFALNQGLDYLADKNTSSIANARKLDYTTFVDSDFPPTSSSWTFTATLDRYALPDTYENTLRKGAANDVPIITGNTRDESGATYGLNITIAEYLADLNETYSGQWVDKFLELYPGNNASQASKSENQQFTDRSIIGTWIWAQKWKQAAKSPIYTYIWDHAPPGQSQGAYHESEINYVLNNLYGTDSPWTDEDYEIAATMNSYWVNFIKTGDPNGQGLTRWDKSNSKEITQRLGDGFGPVPLALADRVKLMEEWLLTQPVW
ncbi:alpha/beta-hydrolase [Aureobasidium pullulans]|nr:alpha/beta-hydrolase [Aureobasidium pullulans]